MMKTMILALAGILLLAGCSSGSGADSGNPWAHSIGDANTGPIP